MFIHSYTHTQYKYTTNVKTKPNIIEHSSADIAYSIFLIISINGCFCIMKFSKLKLIKSYLRLIVSIENLNKEQQR